jgi:hypothetical protein
MGPEAVGWQNRRRLSRRLHRQPTLLMPRGMVIRSHEPGQQWFCGSAKAKDGDEDHHHGCGDYGGQVGVVGYAVRVKEVVDQRNCSEAGTGL